MEIYQGQQIIRYLGGPNTGYDDCSQIVLSIYLNDTLERKLAFVKVPDSHFPNAGIILEADQMGIDAGYSVKFTLTKEMTDDLEPGLYYMEASRTMLESGQIFKDRVEFITVKKSTTL